MIQVQNLCISFNDSEIISDLSFSVTTGELFTLTGDSGKGKTSVFSAILGFIKPKSGKIIVENLELNHSSVHSIRNKIGWLPQNLNSFPNLQVNLQLNLLQSFKHNHLKFTIDEFKELAEIFRLRNDILTGNFAELSGGEKQRVALIFALLQKKSILLLDEPTSALDETSEKIIVSYLKEQKEITILSASHSDFWISNSDKTLRI